MPRRRSEKKKRKAVGIEAIVEPGVEAIYSRGAWMKKLDYLYKGKKLVRRRKVKRKQR